MYKNGSNSSCAALMFTNSLDETKDALASYCAKLTELNKDVWNDFLVSYVEDMLDEIGIVVKEGTVETIFELTENTIKGLCGDNGAANEVVNKLQGMAKEKIKSGIWGENKLQNFVEKHFSQGEKIVDTAQRLENMKRKLEYFSGQMQYYGLALSGANGLYSWGRKSRI